MNERAIVRGKRECCFIRNQNDFSLVVVCDESWKETAGTEPVTGQVMLFKLSPSAACVWRLLKERPTGSQLLERLSRRYGLSADQIEGPLGRFLKRLEQDFLIGYADVPGNFPSAYQLVTGKAEIPMDDVAFDRDALMVEPHLLLQEVFCDNCPSDPHCGWAQPSFDTSCMGCLLCF
jgi:hypothetical protein